MTQTGRHPAIAQATNRANPPLHNAIETAHPRGGPSVDAVVGGTTRIREPSIPARSLEREGMAHEPLGRGASSKSLSE